LKCGQRFQGAVKDHDCIMVLRALVEDRVDRRTFNLALETLSKRVEATDKFVRDQIKKSERK
jgi:hypothetical protein